MTSLKKVVSRDSFYEKTILTETGYSKSPPFRVHFLAEGARTTVKVSAAGIWATSKVCF